MNDAIDVTVEQPTTAVEVRKPEAMPVATVQPTVQTAAQAKVEAVANLTFKAYERASMLTLTQEESAALQQPFDDADFLPGAAGKENLIYIQHSALRDRLNKVIGLGQWSIIPRNRWNEKFTFYSKNDRCQKEADRVYVEAMLLIRGAFVAEAVGDMAYYPNDSTNYGDAVEGAKTAAFRRCAKELGVGLQAWDKTWCEQWWQRRRQSAAFKPEAPKTYPKPTESSAPSEIGERFDDAKAGASEKTAVTVVRMSKKEGKSAKTGKPWTLHGVLLLFASDGKEHWTNTFSDTVANAAETLLGQPALVVTEPGKNDSLNLVSIEPAADDLPM